MPPKPRKIFHKDCINLFRLNSRRERIQPAAAEIHAADVIISGTAGDRPALLFRKGAADLLLILQRILCRIIVVGQPRVKPNPHCHNLLPRDSVAIEQPRQPIPVKVQCAVSLCQRPIFIDIQVRAERRFDLNVQAEFSVRLLHIDLFDQHPQVCFRHGALSENVVDHADVPFELRLPIPQDSGDILQFFDLLFCRSDFFLAFLDHAVAA